MDLVVPQCRLRLDSGSFVDTRSTITDPDGLTVTGGTVTDSGVSPLSLEVRLWTWCLLTDTRGRIVDPGTVWDLGDPHCH